VNAAAERNGVRRSSLRFENVEMMSPIEEATLKSEAGSTEEANSDGQVVRRVLRGSVTRKRFQASRCGSKMAAYREGLLDVKRYVPPIRR